MKKSGTAVLLVAALLAWGATGIAQEEGGSKCGGGKCGGGRCAKPSFTSMDADGNGSVSLEEMKAVMLKMVETKFAAMDADGDGALTEKELAAKKCGGKCKGRKAPAKAPAKAAGASKCGGGCGGCKSKK